MRHKTIPNLSKARLEANARLGLAFHIAQRRMSLGMTQEQLAMKVGLSRTSIVNVEQGRQGIISEALPIWAKALKWSTLQLVKGLE